MEERDVASMYSVKAWQKPKTENIVKQLDTSTSKIDEKQKPLLAAIAKLLVGATYDIHGDVTDQKYRYILDTMMVRVRAALTDKLSQYSENYSSEISQCIEEFNKHNVNQYEDIDDRINDILSTTHKDKDEILKTIINAIKNSKDSEKQHKKNLLDVLSMFEKKQKHDTISKQIAQSNIKSINIQQKICKQTKLLEKRQQQISKVSLKNFKMANLNVKNNINSLDSKIKDQFSIVNSQIDSVNDTISKISSGSFLSNMFSGITNFLLSPLKFIIHGIFATGKWLLKIPIAILDHVIFRPLKSIFSFILKPFVLGFKALEDFITNQFKAIKDTLLDTLKSIFTNPIGIAFLAFIISFVWNRWLKPIFEPIWNHIVDWLKRTIASLTYILSPFKDWLNGKTSFTDALKDFWNRFSDEISSWWTTAMNDLKIMIYGDDAYEKDKNGNILQQKITDKGEEKTIPLTKNWTELLYSSFKKNVWPWLKEEISKLLDFEIGGMKLKHWLLIWFGLATAHYAASLISDAKVLGKTLWKFAKAPFILGKDIFKGGKFLYNKMFPTPKALPTNLTTVPNVNSIPTSNAAPNVNNMTNKQLTKEIADRKGISTKEVNKQFKGDTSKMRKSVKSLRHNAANQTQNATKVTENAVKNTNKVANNAAKTANNTAKAGSKLTNFAKAGAGIAAGIAIDAGLSMYDSALGGKTDADGNVVKAEGIGYDIADNIGSMAMMFGAPGIAVGATIKAGTEVVKQLDELNQINTSFEEKIEESVQQSKEMWENASKIQKTTLKDLEYNLKEIDSYDSSMGELEKRVKDTEGWWHGVWNPGDHANAVTNLENAKSRRESLLKQTGYSSVEELRNAIQELKTPKIDYETSQMIQNGISEFKKQAEETESTKDDELAETMQQAFDTGNDKIISQLKEILSILKDKSKNSSYKSSYMFFGQSQMNQALIENS